MGGLKNQEGTNEERKKREEGKWEGISKATWLFLPFLLWFLSSSPATRLPRLACGFLFYIILCVCARASYLCKWVGWPPLTQGNTCQLLLLQLVHTEWTTKAAVIIIIYHTTPFFNPPTCSSSSLCHQSETTRSEKNNMTDQFYPTTVTLTHETSTCLAFDVLCSRRKRKISCWILQRLCFRKIFMCATDVMLIGHDELLSNFARLCSKKKLFLCLLNPFLICKTLLLFFVKAK